MACLVLNIELIIPIANKIKNLKSLSRELNLNSVLIVIFGSKEYLGVQQWRANVENNFVMIVGEHNALMDHVMDQEKKRKDDIFLFN